MPTTGIFRAGKGYSRLTVRRRTRIAHTKYLVYVKSQTSPSWAQEKVQRKISAEVDTAHGLLLSPKSFTTALLACCANDDEKNRLFQCLRGEGEWRRVGDDGEDGFLRSQACFSQATLAENPWGFSWVRK